MITAALRPPRLTQFREATLAEKLGTPLQAERASSAERIDAETDGRASLQHRESTRRLTTERASSSERIDTDTDGRAETPRTDERQKPGSLCGASF